MGKGRMPKIKMAAAGAGTRSGQNTARSETSGGGGTTLIPRSTGGGGDHVTDSGSVAPSHTISVISSYAGPPNSAHECLTRVEEYQESSRRLVKKNLGKHSTTAVVNEAKTLGEAVHPLQKAIKMVETFQQQSRLGNSSARKQYSPRVPHAPPAVNRADTSKLRIQHPGQDGGALPGAVEEDVTSPRQPTMGVSPTPDNKTTTKSNGSAGVEEVSTTNKIGNSRNDDTRHYGEIPALDLDHQLSPQMQKKRKEEDSNEDISLRLKLAQLYILEGDLLVKKNKGTLNPESERELSKGTLLMTTVLQQQGFITRGSDQLMIQKLNPNAIKKPTTLMREAQEVVKTPNRASRTPTPVPEGGANSSGAGKKVPEGDSSGATTPQAASPSSRSPAEKASLESPAARSPGIQTQPDRTALPPFLVMEYENPDRARSPVSARKNPANADANNKNDEGGEKEGGGSASGTQTDDNAEEENEDDMDDVEVRMMIQEWRNACCLLSNRYIATAFNATSKKEKQNRCRMSIRLITRCLLCLKDVGSVDGTEASLAAEMCELLVSLGKAYVIYEFFTEAMQCAEQALICRPDSKSAAQLEGIVRKRAAAASVYSAAMCVQRCFRVFKAKRFTTLLQVQRKACAVLVLAAIAQLSFTANAFPKPTSLQILLSQRGYYRTGFHNQLNKSGIQNLEDLANVSEKKCAAMGLRMTVAKDLIRDAQTTLEKDPEYIQRKAREEKTDQKELKLAHVPHPPPPLHTVENPLSPLHPNNTQGSGANPGVSPSSVSCGVASDSGASPASEGENYSQQGNASKKRQSLQKAIDQNAGSKTTDQKEELILLQETESQSRCQIISLYFTVLREMLGCNSATSSAVDSSIFSPVESFYLASWRRAVYLNFSMMELAQRNQVVAEWWTLGVALRRKLEIQTMLLNPDLDLGESENSAEFGRLSTSVDNKNSSMWRDVRDDGSSSQLYKLIFTRFDHDSYSLFSNTTKGIEEEKELRRQIGHCCCCPLAAPVLPNKNGSPRGTGALSGSDHTAAVQGVALAEKLPEGSDGDLQLSLSKEPSSLELSKEPSREQE